MQPLFFSDEFANGYALLQSCSHLHNIIGKRLFYLGDPICSISAAILPELSMKVNPLSLEFVDKNLEQTMYVS